VRRLTVLAVALAAACAAAAATAAEPLGKAAFLAKADQVCGAYNKKIDRAFASAPNADPTSPATPVAKVKLYAPILARAADLFGREIDELAELEGPPVLEAELRRALATLRKGLAGFRPGVAAARKGDRRTLALSLAALQSSTTSANVIAKRIGLRVCGAN
jgi:hypothetical protein